VSDDVDVGGAVAVVRFARGGDALDQARGARAQGARGVGADGVDLGVDPASPQLAFERLLDVAELGHGAAVGETEEAWDEQHDLTLGVFNHLDKVGP
jgi:hypothetical protein